MVLISLLLMCIDDSPAGQLFGLSPDDFSNLAMVENEAKGRYEIWKSLHEFNTKTVDWTAGPILTSEGNVRLSFETVKREVDEYGAKAYKLGKANKEVQIVLKPLKAHEAMEDLT